MALVGGDAWVIHFSAETAYVVDAKANRVVHVIEWRAPRKRVPTVITTGAGKAWIGLDCCEVVALPLPFYGSEDRVPLTPPAEAVGADGVWVATANDRLWRIDPHGYPPKVAASISPPGHVSDIAAASRAVWVSATNGLLMRVDPATNRIARTLRLGFAPTSLAIGYGSLWVLDPRHHAVREFDLDAETFVRTIPLGTEPVEVAVGAGGVWLSNGGDGTISRIDPGSGKVVATTKVGPRADDIAVGDGLVWVIAHPR